MKKTLTLTLTLSLLFILTGCDRLEKELAKDEAKESGAVESVLNALKNNSTLKCDYIDEDGELVKTYIKGDRVYVIGNEEDELESTLRGLITKDKYYLWSTETNEGAIIELDVDEEDAIELKGKKVKNAKEIIEFLENNSQSCVYATIENSVFEIPSGIEFKDW